MNKPDILLGAHFSIQGGLHKALERGINLGCTVVQVFTHNPRQWALSRINESDPELFQQKRGTLIIAGHSSYLINLASGNEDVRKKSAILLTQELKRTELFKIPYLILHPGSTGHDDEKKALTVFTDALDKIIESSENTTTKILLETTAGHSGSIGYKFEHLRDIISLSAYPEKIGICFDTCHVFAAGYDIRDEEKYNQTLSQFEEILGLDKLNFFHLNDALKEFGTHKDRHTHIGKGTIGLDGFRLIMNDRRFLTIGKCLETPKGDNDEWDTMNLTLLRSLVEFSP